MSAEMQLVYEQKHRSALHHEVLDSHGLTYRQKPTRRRRARTRLAFSRGDCSQWAQRPSASDRIKAARFSMDASTIRPPVCCPLRRAEDSSPPTCLLGPGERNQGFRVENPRPHGDKPCHAKRKRLCLGRRHGSACSPGRRTPPSSSSRRSWPRTFRVGHSGRARHGYWRT